MNDDDAAEHDTAGHDTAELMAAVRQGRRIVTRRTQALALLLHGGRAEVEQPQRLKDISYLRMLPFAAAIWRASRGRIAPVLVHNRHGGWIASSGSGVVQTREIVRGLVEEHDRPVVLLGHSSGGWASIRAGDEPGVLGSVALAPWVGEKEWVSHLVDRKVRVIHGDADTVCDPEKARRFVERLQEAGGDATYESVPGGNHALLDRPWRWHARATRAVLDVAW